MRQLGFDKVFAITPQMPEWRVWQQYFEAHLGFLPAGMIATMRETCKEFLVPAQWPSWFDSSFNEDPHWQPRRKAPPKRQPLPPEADYQTMSGLYGRPLGVNEQGTKWEAFVGHNLTNSQARTTNWRPPTDDELRAHYGHKAEAAE